MKKINTILIIDDDKDDQDLFVEMINEINPSIICITALEGQEGLTILKNRLEDLPDFIFLDLNMHGMNGKECLKVLKENDSFKDIPVAIYTTSSTDRDKKETADLGATFFITKASSIAVLRKEIAFVLSQ